MKFWAWMTFLMLMFMATDIAMHQSGGTIEADAVVAAVFFGFALISIPKRKE